MEKRELMFYVITFISLIAFAYFSMNLIFKISGNSSVRGLTGNLILDLEDNYQINDNLTGSMVLDLGEKEAYGFALLTKGNKTILTKTFNLNNIPKNLLTSGQYSINLEEIISYQFEEKGIYELFLSVLDLDIKIEKEFEVK
jgi:hypothetical protein